VLQRWRCPKYEDVGEGRRLESALLVDAQGGVLLLGKARATWVGDELRWTMTISSFWYKRVGRGYRHSGDGETRCEPLYGACP
jgi:hypothetical protein